MIQGKMPKRTGGKAHETSGRGMAARRPHPNGGETRPAEGPELGDMPKRTGGTPIQYSDLEVTLGKMPKRTGGPQQRDPYRR